MRGQLLRNLIPIPIRSTSILEKMKKLMGGGEDFPGKAARYGLWVRLEEKEG